MREGGGGTFPLKPSSSSCNLSNCFQKVKEGSWLSQGDTRNNKRGKRRGYARGEEFLTGIKTPLFLELHGKEGRW